MVRKALFCLLKPLARLAGLLVGVYAAERDFGRDWHHSWLVARKQEIDRAASSTSSPQPVEKP